jgi:Putative transposase/Transposase zinc-binding domain
MDSVAAHSSLRRMRSAGCAGSRAEALGRGRQTYVRRQPEQSVLHGVVREHLETFLAEARERGGGDGVPPFVERELREFLTCGVMASGFARFRCRHCAHEVLVAFSCKGRGFCPSCCGRRMAELAAHLTDGVLGGLPVRQWVLTVPHRLRYALAWDHRLCRAVLAVFVRAVLGFERRRARRRGVSGGTGGAVTAIQRFGSALNTNVHFHTVVAQGVFAETANGRRFFAPAPAPSAREVTRLLAAVRRRIVRLVARCDIDLAHPNAETDGADERLLDCPAYAQIQGAAVLGRLATGPRAGGRVMRVRGAPAETAAPPAGALQAHLAGFDLHAAVAVPAGDRARLEHLCRYVLRPPVAQGALEQEADGSILLRLRRPWRDGTRAVRFAPTELLEKLAAMIPKPRINLLVYHGAFAPNARGRREAVHRAEEGTVALASAGSPDRAGEGVVGPRAAGLSREAQSSPASPAAPATVPAASTPPAPPGRQRPRRYWSWAELLRRTFAIDVLACPGCGGRLRLLATIAHPPAITKILRHLGLPAEVPRPVPARQRAW